MEIDDQPLKWSTQVITQELAGNHCHSFVIIKHAFVIITANSEQQTQSFVGISCEPYNYKPV